MAKKTHLQIGPRDESLLASLEYSPFTATQIVELSKTFPQSFPDEHTLRRRLRQMAAAGLVQAFPYAVASLGRSPSYFKLTRNGYRRVHGNDALLPHRRYFEAVSDAHHHHTLALAEFLVRLFTAAHEINADVRKFARENSVTFETNHGRLRPDCAFQLLVSGRPPLNFVVELDNGTERVRSQLDVESIERKICGYDAHQQGLDAFDRRRYVVLFVTTRSKIRLDAMLDAAQQLASNPQRRLFLGTTLEEFLGADSPLLDVCFVDTQGKRTTLIPRKAQQRSTADKLVRFPASTVAFC